MNKKMIVVLPAGWVFCGLLEQREKQSVLSNAVCIRRWGTTAGLGELALKGPRKETILDHCGTVIFKTGSEICMMPCQTDNWD